MTSVPACAVFGYFAPVYTVREQRGWQNRRRRRLLTQQSVRPLTSVASGGLSCRCIKTRRPAATLATVSKEGENILNVEYNGTMFHRILSHVILGKRNSLGRQSVDLIIIYQDNLCKEPPAVTPLSSAGSSKSFIIFSDTFFSR